MRRKCPACGHHWAWALADGRFKCRGCQSRYRVRTAWQSARLSEAAKRRLLDYFVPGVPAYRLRFHALASTPTVERFYRLIRQVLAIAEESTTAFTGSIECDGTMFGGYRAGAWMGGSR
jgi:transposase